MDISHILTFFGGFIADIARRVLLPQSEEWIARFIPQARKAQNLKKNLLQLEVREKLTKMGYDPALADGIETDTSEFRDHLNNRYEGEQDAFVEVEANRLAASVSSQAEANQIAFDRYATADRLLTLRVDKFVQRRDLSPAMRVAFQDAQDAWESFREKDALAEGLFSAEGGSMMPLVHGDAMERETIDRLARLKEFEFLTGGR